MEFWECCIIADTERREGRERGTKRDRERGGGGELVTGEIGRQLITNCYRYHEKCVFVCLLHDCSHQRERERERAK